MTRCVVESEEVMSWCAGNVEALDATISQLNQAISQTRHSLYALVKLAVGDPVQSIRTSTRVLGFL